MKLIYVAHAWGGDEKQKEDAERIIKNLFMEDMDNCYVSPIHGILAPYDSVDYTDGLALAMTLMRKCDGVLVCPGWTDSVGVRGEIAMAKSLGIPVRFI